MLEKICRKTDEFIKTMPKELRKGYGQFFTDGLTASFMASLFQIPQSENGHLTVLDAGAGSGILSAALVQRLLAETAYTIHLTCYETDSNILPLLSSNMEELKQGVDNRFHYTLHPTNYILENRGGFHKTLFDQDSCRYDMIIGNPPYKKIPKDAPEAIAMPEVCYGAPNLYFLFMAMGVSQLKENAEMVYIVPRSWTSGAYFEHFRKYLFQNTVLKHIHLFESRDKVFGKENVLQETMIVKVGKTTQQPATVCISTTPDSRDFSQPTRLEVPYNIIVSGRRHYVFLVTNTQEIENLRRLNALNHTLPSLGLRMKTGLVVDFRSREYLHSEHRDDTIPLIYSSHIRDGRVRFPVGRENEYVAPTHGMLQKNKNYLFLKRFTAKEESRRLQCGIYLSQYLPQYQYISSQNKVNFVDSDGELSECIIYGLYVLFNSRPYDVYYRILNGSTQVNSTEINNMPMPALSVIELMGKEAIASKNLSEDNCDRILKQYVTC